MVACEKCSLSLGLISSVLFFRPETPDGSNPLNRWAELSCPIQIFGRLRVHFSYTRTNQVGCGSISNPIRPDSWIALHQPIKFQWNVKQLGLQLWRITIIGILVVFFFISINGWYLTIQYMEIVLAVKPPPPPQKGIITVNPPVVRPIFTLPTRSLKLYTIPTWTSIYYPSIAHLSLCR